MSALRLRLPHPFHSTRAHSATRPTFGTPLARLAGAVIFLGSRPGLLDILKRLKWVSRRVRPQRSSSCPEATRREVHLVLPLFRRQLSIFTKVQFFFVFLFFVFFFFLNQLATPRLPRRRHGDAPRHDVTSAAWARRLGPRMGVKQPAGSLAVFEPGTAGAGRQAGRPEERIPTL